MRPRPRPLTVFPPVAFLLALLFALSACSEGPATDDWSEASSASPGGGDPSLLPSPQAHCALAQVARLKLQVEHGLPLVAVAINGQPVWMVADTGAERSILTTDAVARLQLPHDVGRLSRTMGIGGPSSNWDVILDSMVMGGVRFPVNRLAVGNFNILNDGGAVPAGLLGADILLAFDLDIDISAHTITLYRARHCADARPPWDEPAIPIQGITTRKDRLMLPVTLDGTTAAGLLDTGAQHTTIGSELAERIGVTDGVMVADPVVMQHGAGPQPVPSHLHRFSSLAVGPVRTPFPELTVVPSAYGVGDALVGQDFLSGRRVWISFATARVFVTPGKMETALATR